MLSPSATRPITKSEWMNLNPSEKKTNISNSNLANSWRHKMSASEQNQIIDLTLKLLEKDIEIKQLKLQIERVKSKLNELSQSLELDD